MKEIKLSGREIAILRAIDFATGATGPEIVEHSRIERDDVLDILNGLSDVGFLEGYAPGKDLPIPGRITAEEFEVARFEVNPSYALQLRGAMRR